MAAFPGQQQHMPLRNGTVVGQVVLHQQYWPRFEQGVALVFSKCAHQPAVLAGSVNTHPQVDGTAPGSGA